MSSASSPLNSSSSHRLLAAFLIRFADGGEGVGGESGGKGSGAGGINGGGSGQVGLVEEKCEWAMWHGQLGSVDEGDGGVCRLRRGK